MSEARGKGKTMTDKKGFAAALMAWHRENARDLPWHGESDPYRIWLSEIMLQQTRTETVKRYYAAFLKAFPTVRALAEAEEADVLKLWEGLGYYSRARNLHAAAKMVQERFHGEFPKDEASLRELPGVGEYAAGAVASIAFGQKTPAIDGNQARALARVWNVRDEIKTAFQLRPQAEALMPDDEPGEYNQALMGLGAMICTPRNPDCESCPVRAFCEAYREGNPEALPRKPEKRARRVEERAVALVFVKDGVLVRKREKGLLKGLWEFPGYAGARTAEDVAECLKEEGLDAHFQGELGKATHIFTHLEWHMKGFRFSSRETPEGWKAANEEELNALAFPTALKKYREDAARILRETGGNR